MLFWLHLVCGVAAGVVILIMSVTGVLLAYQRQITAWADTRGYHVEPASERLTADAIVAKVRELRPDVSPTAVMVRSEPTAPASLTIGTGRQLIVGGVRLNQFKRLRVFNGIAPFRPFDRRQGQVGVQHGVEHIDKGHMRDHCAP